MAPCCECVQVPRDWRECDHLEAPETVRQLRAALVCAAKVAGGELDGECTFDCVVYYADILKRVPVDATQDSWVEYSL